MLSNRKTIVSSGILLLIFSFLIGCVTVDSTTKKEETIIIRPEKTVASYEDVGRRWGTRHWQMGLKPGGLDEPFINALIEPNNLDFFWVHADLKNAFIKGYRFGYQDRTADLVLGPNITEAAARIGQGTARRFVEVINAFERGWAETLNRAIHVFITLISEGSQADREDFIRKFISEYTVKYNETQEKLKAGGFIAQVSEGGTMLYIDATKTLAILDIPKPETLKTEIYHQTFKVMGDEWGRRFSHNLIKRDELIDLLRRSKTALQEVQPGLAGNMGIIKDAFLKSYGTDAEYVFNGLIKDAGYEIKPKPVELPKNEKPKPSTKRKR
ncbi:MAG: hypothetical protein OEW69_01775 [Nitrospirota bacterium]|nr:hypothetical protein [Nitrospirota bacterium]